MAGRALNRVFRSSDCILRRSAPAFTGQRRNFTSSNARRKHGAVPTFTETSSSELQDLLANMRENVFLPAHLSTAHQKLIFKTKHRKTLEDDPVTVEISGEDFRLKHINRMTDQIGTRDSIVKMLSLMKDNKDWSNLPIFLEGLESAGRNVTPWQKQKIVRTAGRAGQQHVILECARRASRTGFILRDLRLVISIMWWTQFKALSADWTASATKQAFGMAEQIADLLEDEKHCGRSVLWGSDPRVRPEVVGILLQLAAAHAKVSSGKDDDGKVEIYARRLLGTLAREVNFEDGIGQQPEGKVSEVSNALLCSITPIVYGLRAAAEILEKGSNVAKQLRKREQALAERATLEYEKIMATESAEDSTKRIGIWSYNMLLRPQKS